MIIASVILASALSSAPASTSLPSSPSQQHHSQAALPFGTPMPATAGDEAEIFSQAERRKGFAWMVSSASFVSVAGRVLVVWWNPYSGRATHHAYGYVWVAPANHWQLCVQQAVDTSDLSAELASGSTLVLRNQAGKEILRQRMDQTACALGVGFGNSFTPKPLRGSD